MHQSESQGVHYRSLDFLGYPWYEVGDDGSVWGLYCGGYVGRARKRLSPKRDRRGYLRVRLANGAYHKRTFQVHRLVLLAFVGPCPEGMQTRHFPDPDRTNNRLENLRWGTAKENAADRAVQQAW